MFTSWQWIIILIILAVVVIFTDDKETKYKDHDCYDKSTYRCLKCNKNCKWHDIVVKYNELDE